MLRILPLLAVAASIHSTDVPSALGARVERAKPRSDIPVLLPQTLRSEFARLFGDVSAGSGPTQRVRLAKGRTGRFTPVSCGANCSSPTIQWKERGDVYEVEAKGLPEKSERRGVVKLANSAIRHGPR